MMLSLVPILAILPPLPLNEQWIARPSPNKGVDALGITSFASSGDRVFVAGREGYTALDLRTGRILWEAPAKEQIAISLAAAGSDLFVSLDDGQLRSVDPATGRTIWGLSRKGFASDLRLEPQVLYAQLAYDSLSAIERKGGRIRWTKKIPAEVKARNPALVSSPAGDADSLYFATRGRRLVRLRKFDGQRLWSQPLSSDWADFSLGPRFLFVRDGEWLAAHDKLTGRRKWRSGVAHLGGRAVRAYGNDVFLTTDRGLLLRYNGATGRREALAQVGQGLGPSDAPGLPFTFQGSLHLASGRSLLRLSPDLRPTAEFDTTLDGSSLRTLVTPRGLLLANYDSVRLIVPSTRPSLPVLPVARAALAEQIVSKLRWEPRDVRLLQALGGDAAPALARRVREQGDRQALEVLYSRARAPQTHVVADLWRWSITNGAGNEPRGAAPLLTEWLRTRGESAIRSSTALEVYRTAPPDSQARHLSLSLLALSRDPDAVAIVLEQLRRRGRDEAGTKETLYTSAAASEVPQVLAELRQMRNRSRTVERRFAAKLPAGDLDRDGLPNDVDRNPYAPPRPLAEEERVLATAFEARFHFDERSRRVGGVEFPGGMKPFELFGWQGQILPEARINRSGEMKRRYEYPFIRFETADVDPEGRPVAIQAKSPVRFSPDRRRATVAIGTTFGSLDGTGFAYELRKIGGEWYVVNARVTWVS